MERAAPHVTGWPAEILGSGDRDMPDATAWEGGNPVCVPIQATTLMEVNFPTDSDGFLSRECPSCGKRFKVCFDQGSEEPISYCPYCRHNEQDCWFTQNQIENVQAIAASTVVAPELDKLAQELERMSGGFARLDMTSDIIEASIPPMETDDDLRALRLPCCGEIVKVEQEQEYYCIICGGEVNMATINSTRIFLSHKGSDKNTVIDFKETLELLGYEPWLDEEAMPAGTTLERGLLRGMQKSCAVVFFLTPSFKDEGYVQAEIDYAIAEKRKKGDAFAIITLRFADEDNGNPQVPELLQPYVWKTPRTQLDALREIVRALPVVVGPVEWRGALAGVTSHAQGKPTQPAREALSDEARTTLKKAADGDGFIHALQTIGGTFIEAGGSSLNRDQDPRTVARWRGALEDLQRLRYIKDSGHKGEVFQVTREGYDATDRLS